MFDSPPELEGIELGGSAESVKKALIDRRYLLRVTYKSELGKDDARPKFTEVRITASSTRERPKLLLEFMNDRLVSVGVASPDNQALLASLLRDSRVGRFDRPVRASINHSGEECVYVEHVALAEWISDWVDRYS